jgi:hypothetical protein
MFVNSARRGTDLELMDDSSEFRSDMPSLGDAAVAFPKIESGAGASGSAGEVL